MVIFYLVLVIAFLFTCFGALFDAVWIPTSKKDYDRIAKLAGFKPGLLFYDLGSGTGKMLFYFSKKYKVRCVGIEISPILYLFSKIKSLFYGDVYIGYGNFYKHDLNGADVVYIFLLRNRYDKLNRYLIPKLHNHTKLVVSCWPLLNYKPAEISTEKQRVPIYLYKNFKK